ncbi:hypothetical protein AGDE_01374 [Angomonas deanei]|uniref:Uncharacterized protein n=1 Tax=Angomonas deanei TaxID=59799 RepID=A0A7G2CAQ9_9TRYP|nr:hypothetical protein AGDE_01374 [Angomonas deanei]CAD2215112.1 hypothetical protein, conserved [Angomonas deanei]|eukprot:EPY42549.1 hypothetical protein AGDE_01374 [Angomonas deanei]
MDAAQLLSRSSTLSYHCILSPIPTEYPLAALAEHITPREGGGDAGTDSGSSSSPCVTELATLHYRLVPYQLQVFKEDLPYKFGYVSYMAFHTNGEESTSDTTREAVHALVLRWIQSELVPQLLLAKTTVHRAQPAGMTRAEEFLTTVEACPCVAQARDPSKMRAFLLSKVSFPASENNNSNPQEVAQTRVLDTSLFVGKELLWLKKELPATLAFPPVLVTNSNAESTACDAKD